MLRGAMRYIISALFGLFLTFSVTLTPVQAVENTWDYSVQVSSAVQPSPAKITLTWPQDTNGVPNSYTIFRKTPGSTSWGNGTQLPGSATSYTDTNVASGTAYEYRVVKATGSYTGYGYIHTGINAPLVDQRGKVVLIVDNTFTTSLASELTRLEQDLAGDGWTVIRHDVPRTASVATVKGLIKAAYDADRANVKSVFLFGHIAVPYSGQLNPDGHPDHIGAWPADAYYGDMDGNWTDSSVNYTQTINTNKIDAARMSNVPGDGKFDQTTLPSAIELAVGRVDLAKMPGRVTWGGPATFPSETDLMRKYLNKDHNFRHRKTNPPRRAVLGDYFGARGGEAFAASGFRSFAPLVGASNIRNLNKEFNDQKGVWIPQVAANDYLLAYGCGAGSYSTIGGLGSTGIYNDGSTTEMVSNNVRGVFNLLFGSWLGDWDSEDNFLRSPLATDHGLVAAWSGRPHWFMHSLGQGESIGQIARLAQNNTDHYQTQINSSANRIHIALMGDPTLRLHPVVPVSNLGGTSTGSTANLTWAASTDSAIVGYHVYRRTTATGAFTRLTSSPVTGNTFADNSSTSGATYMVRAIKLENTPSGSYHNASQGIFWTVGGAPSTEPPVATTPDPTDPTDPTDPAPEEPTDPVVTNPPSDDTSTPTDPTTPSTNPPSDSATVVWVEDALPAGAGGSTNGDTWNWVTSPAPFSGSKAHKSDLKSGLHEHSFNWATPLTVGTGEVLFTYVYLDPANPPSQIMLSWASANWEHRAYWGSNNIGYGVDKTSSRYYMGPLPAAGKWVRLEVPASAVALEGASIVGMGFSLYNGAATWDYSGKSLPGAPDLEVEPAPTPTPPPTPAPTNDTVWFDDSLPRGAGGGASGGDAWKWVNSNPAPFSGKVAHQSSLSNNLHEHFFNWANDKLSVATGERLFTYVYIDPANKPTEIMLSWMSDNWEHRAYWGEDRINYGKKGTAGRYYAGPIPAAGQWVRLEVPAKAVGLEGHSISGMTFSLFGGRVTWDKSGKSSGTAPAPTDPAPTDPGTTPTEPTPTEPAPTVGTDVPWFDDALPAGASGSSTGGDSWNWITSNPTPHSGTKAHQSNLAAGLHEHFFGWGASMKVATGDRLYAYVYLDPASPPTSIMLSWGSDNWEHRAYWGANQINYGTTGTASRYNAGALPATGKWVRLEVPASAVGLEGHTVTMMGFSLFGGRATWDVTGKTTASTSGDTTSPTPTDPVTPPAETKPEVVWIEDAIPAGAGINAGGEGWNWVSGSPAPYSGSNAHQSANAAGLHEHSFAWAGAALNVAAGDTLFTYVYLDPASPPSEIMLSFGSDNWEHRAYWGANKISYGTDGTASRRYMGALPPAGQWVRLEVPASKVNLEGHKVTMMGFSTFDGRATWDKTGLNGAAKAGEIVAGGSTTTPTDPVDPTDPTTDPTTPTDPVVTNPPPTTDPTDPSDPTDPTDPTTDPTTPPTTDPGNAVAENAALAMPNVGDTSLTVLTPTLLELRRVTAKEPDPATLKDWNFVSNGTFNAPAASQFAVTVNGQSVGVKQVGFRRRALYAPLQVRDLRVDNALYLELNGTIADGATVEVKNPGGALWPAAMEFKSKADPLRHSPAIHVNQEGYVPSFPKKAMVGYYLGNLGELDVNASLGFKIVTASTGVAVHTGTLTPRRETGYQYSPLPYQKVYEADFSSVTAPGEYQLVVPGLGASFPFLINEGVAMAFTRTYALGLYHQRCGVANALPFTRHTHEACHLLKAEIPSPQSSYAFTWSTIASKNGDAKNDPRHTAPQLKDEASQLYPFVNKGPIDVTLGHHDAGDYSKYTINVAQLLHTLTFTADSIAGAGTLDNLGLPESGDGVSDILQEAKHEADYLAKLQDADGGFYFIVYPKTREYESNVMPDKGDQQVVWPKNTSATAASVAALAQIASSPAFKAKYPTEAAAYLAKAKLGWQFLTSAISKHGKDGSYQKVTFYGHNYLHDDELAWAAAQMFLATGEAQYHQKLLEWFPNPADTATMRWGWWRMSESWGNALRSYAFGARSGRIAAGQLNAGWLAKAEEQIKLAGEDALKWSNQSAYGTAFPEATRHVMGAGWYFSLDQASDIAVAYQLNPKPEYITALVGNMNYEAGTNPVNRSYLTGLGLTRQLEVVNQHAANDRQLLPPAGIPIGNVQDSPQALWFYPGAELRNLAFPTDEKGGAMYPFYDRWTDTWNVTTEFITVNQARGLLSAAVLAGQTAAKSGAWKPSQALKVNVPSGVAEVGTPITLTFEAAGLNLAGARITWEARDQQPDFGSTYTIAPKNAGTQWVEVEVTWPDGRRLVGTGSFEANASLVNWVDDAIPAGATTSAVNDAWNWVTSSPAPKSGAKAHQTAAGTGLREHAFNYAGTPLVVGTGDTLFAWVYLDAAAMPETIMLHWNDGSWDHRAFWGADKINYGTPNTASRRSMGALPAGGGWVKLEVPASAVGLEGKSVTGMCFSTYGGGKVTWDSAGRTTPAK